MKYFNQLPFPHFEMKTRIVLLNVRTTDLIQAIGKLRLNSRIKPRLYVRRGTLYEKSYILLAGTGVMKISTVACGSSPIKIRYFDYPKHFIDRINAKVIVLLVLEKKIFKVCLPNMGMATIQVI